MHFRPLPVEVLYLILDEVILGRDFCSLKTISMVSKTFRPLCRKHLFRRIVLTFASDRHYAQNSRDKPSSFLEFAAFLISNPHILKSVRKIVLRDISGISSWNSHLTDIYPGTGCNFAPDDVHLPTSTLVVHPYPTHTHAHPKWDTIAGPLAQILGSLEHLQALEIRSELELDWTTFDAQVKDAIYSLLARPSCGAASVLLAALHNVRDRDLLEFVKHCGDLTLANVRFSLRGLRRNVALGGFWKDGIEMHEEGDSDGDDDIAPRLLVQEIDGQPPAALHKLRLGRQVGVDAVDWLSHHPASLVGVKHLTMESLSAAVPVSDCWSFAQGTRSSLEHLEWWLEDLAFREQSDALALKQIDLSLLPHLRSFTIRSSQSGQLVNLMVILEATGATNTIETIRIVMPTNIDKFIAFRPSAVWKRIDSAFGSARFQKRLRQVALSFAWTNQPMLQSSLSALFAAFKKNLPSLRGKDLTVDQRRACLF
ncbi:hypothetical protein BDN70DRAFT_871771 [Pholiota conissans]|uniref:F-box domain-containing protein n=1 Tax=Pholiota conissans TaxID=109636 RepID=A0A9P5ZDP3_9AGAR|nr:hypothetical protein BDN70DRAFT_871771 [Pholiota conissans]